MDQLSTDGASDSEGKLENVLAVGPTDCDASAQLPRSSL